MTDEAPPVRAVMRRYHLTQKPIETIVVTTPVPAAPMTLTALLEGLGNCQDATAEALRKISALIGAGSVEDSAEVLKRIIDETKA